MLRLCEVYLSVQGEGPRVGLPTIFVRFGGCNLRCPLWPCDSQYAVDVKYRNEWERIEPVELANRIIAIADELDSYVNVCLTGGEPFLQPNEDLRVMCETLRTSPWIQDIEAFTNGGLLYPEWSRDVVHKVIDWKLPGSGEDPMNPARIWNVLHNVGPKDVIKFTIADRADYELAKELYRDPQLAMSRLGVYYGVVWAKLTNEELIGWVLEDGMPWRLTMQVHNYIWNRNRRGI